MMKMEIKLKLEPSELTKRVTITLSDLDTTDEEWANMDEDDRRELIDAFVSGFDQPYWDISKVEYIN